MNFKKLIALVLAAVMMMTVVSVFAADAGDLAKDTQVKITGLADGDTVNLYQVLHWVDGEGWKLSPGFESLSDNANIKKLITASNQDTVDLTKADVEAITTAAKAAIASEPTGFVKYNETLDGTTTYTEDVDVGMYLALVSPVNTDTVYNPIIVSADFTTGGTNEIDSSASLGDAPKITKKETVTLTKTTDDIAMAVDDVVQFTITTIIPAYADSYTNPTFTLTDTLSEGLELVVDGDTHKFVVESGDVTYTGAPTASGAKTFTLTFNSDKIQALVQPQPVTIKYWAKITTSAPWNVNEETNDVEVKFSNDPKDDTSHGHKKDESKEYTFTIDGTIFGGGEYRTGELVKVGKDKDGNDILESKELSNESWHSALIGAKFALYTTEADANNDENRYWNTALKTVYGDTKHITSDAKGLMTIPGLDGKVTYYLKEIDAPDGYIKDTKVHTIYIDYTTQTVSKTETLEDRCEVTYDVETLKSYKVTIDGKAESNYTINNNSEPTISTVTPGDSSTEIVNTKGVELPSTGGIGTTLFYAIGGVMVLAAGIVLVTRRKAEEE